MARADENKELEDFIEGQWNKLQDGETRVLQLLPEKTQVIEKKDFNGNMEKKVQFIVVDPNRGTIDRGEKKFEVSRRHAERYNKATMYLRYTDLAGIQPKSSRCKMSSKK